MGEKWMKEVADAGGWDEHALAVLKEIKSIKKEEWGLIHENLKTLKGFIDMNAQGVLNSFTESLTTTIQLKFEEVLAPLKNEWNALINDLLEPLMPMLQQLVTLVIPVVQWIADNIQIIIDMIAQPGPTPPPIDSARMWTYAEFAADYVLTHRISIIYPPDMAALYQQYVDAWIIAHAPIDRIGGYQID